MKRTVNEIVNAISRGESFTREEVADFLKITAVGIEELENAGFGAMSFLSDCMAAYNARSINQLYMVDTGKYWNLEEALEKFLNDYFKENKNE